MRRYRVWPTLIRGLSGLVFVMLSLCEGGRRGGGLCFLPLAVSTLSSSPIRSILTNYCGFKLISIIELVVNRSRRFFRSFSRNFRLLPLQSAVDAAPLICVLPFPLPSIRPLDRLIACLGSALQFLLKLIHPIKQLRLHSFRFLICLAPECRAIKPFPLLGSVLPSCACLNARNDLGYEL